MELSLAASLANCNFTRLLPSKTSISLVASRRASIRPAVLCMAISETSTESVVRRSANFQPAIWHYDFIQSLRSDYTEESCSQRIDKLKGEVRMMLQKAVDPLERLELIDVLQRLGLSYHFDEEIQKILESIYDANYGGKIPSNKENIYATALEFRLLRQLGYGVPQEIFNSFRNEQGNFKASLCDDIKGILCLYEASFLLVEGETILEETRDFTTKQLKEYIKQSTDENLTDLVSHALEVPLHWRMLRLETRRFIDVYRSREDANPILLELATLDFNLVQTSHQEDVKEISRWWKNTGLGEKLSFARDRLMESFLWSAGVMFQPQYGYSRRIFTKIFALITILDDVYDVYGTLDELELFTNAIERWDTNTIDQLPYYMKICFLTLHNSINEIAYDILRERGVNVIPSLRKVWTDLCRSFLLEATWYHKKHTPTFEEYLQNAWVSVLGPSVLVHVYLSITNPITEETTRFLEEYPNIIRWSSTIFRLANDLETSEDEIERGDVSKSLQCYMHETGKSQEESRKYISSLIETTWKKMNKERAVGSSLFQTYVEIGINLARTAQCMYQHGDGLSVSDRETKDRIQSVLINPIPLR
uniref:Isoprene synthase n=1 Tax=Casuarina equisetifolia TaxID=3523 RepID=A0A0M5MSL0_CASEQ|nr:isoprene synthase [Casuarina equisetifolia]